MVRVNDTRSDTRGIIPTTKSDYRSETTALQQTAELHI